jgi:hypothetical protein
MYGPTKLSKEILLVIASLLSHETSRYWPARVAMNILHDQKDIWLFPLELGQGRRWLPRCSLSGTYGKNRDGEKRRIRRPLRQAENNQICERGKKPLFRRDSRLFLVI